MSDNMPITAEIQALTRQTPFFTMTQAEVRALPVARKADLFAACKTLDARLNSKDKKAPGLLTVLRDDLKATAIAEAGSVASTGVMLGLPAATSVDKKSGATSYRATIGEAEFVLGVAKDSKDFDVSKALALYDQGVTAHVVVTHVVDNDKLNDAVAAGILTNEQVTFFLTNCCVASAEATEARAIAAREFGAITQAQLDSCYTVTKGTVSFTVK